MKRIISLMGIVVVLVIFVFVNPNALGQEKKFPVKPINIYIGYSPGGAAAINAPILAEGMKKYLNHPVIVNFKPGAAQLIAAQFVKNSDPDGYTLFYPAYSELSAKVAQEGATLKFRLEDLDSLGAWASTPFTVTVNAKSPWKHVEDLIAAAKQSPGRLSHGSSGVGTANHLLAEFFSRETGIVLNHVPFSGGGPAITALLGGHVDMCCVSLASYGAHIKPGGGLRTLIVFDRERDTGFPEVPTALERGFNIALTSWWGLQAPKGLSKEVRLTLVRAIERAANDPEVISRLVNLGFNSTYLTPEEVNKKVQDEYELSLNIWEKIGLIKK